MPSGESTPRARGFDRRWWLSCSLTMGGPSRRRFIEYQKPSGRSPLPPRKPTAFRMATSVGPVDSKSPSWSSYHRLAAFSHTRADQMTAGPPGCCWPGPAVHMNGPAVPRGQDPGTRLEQLVGGVDHDSAGLPYAHPAAELDSGAWLHPGYLR